ncbi:hypothetical protein ACSBR2_000303 [Camellia fascicularis]
MTTSDVKNRLIGPSGILLHPMVENLIAEKVNYRWEICVSLTEGQFQQVSFVNSIATIKGGTHVDYVTNQITNYYLQRALAKLKDHNNYQVGAASPVNADSQLEEIQQEIHRSRSQLEKMEKRLKYLALPEKPNNIHLFESSKFELAIMNYM